MYVFLAACFVAATAGHWRRGMIGAGLCFLLAASLRWLLPARDVPLLVNRSRLFDSLVLAALGCAIAALAFWIPFARPL